MIYFDNAATTKVRDEVAEYMMKFLTKEYANPSGVYRFGLTAENNIELAREVIAKTLSVLKEELYFTPGGTWGNNLALNSILSRGDSGSVITTEIEHSSVFNVIKHYNIKRQIKIVRVDEYGFVDQEHLREMLNEETALVSIMHVNNEIGTIQNLKELGNLIKSRSKAIFHVDGVQGYSKIPIDLSKTNVDIYSISGHKIHAPKGIGALYIRKNLNLSPVIFGGGQEKGISPGTQNVPGIMALAKAAKISEAEHLKDVNYVRELRERIINGITNIKDHRFNSPMENCSPYILNVGFRGIKSEILLRMMDDDGICVSAGSACSKNKKSRVLEGIGVPKDFLDGSIRISISHYNTVEECDILIKLLEKNIEKIRKVFK